MSSYLPRLLKMKGELDAVIAEIQGVNEPKKAIVAAPPRRSARIATAEAQRLLDWSRDDRFKDYFREYCGKEARRMFSELGCEGI